MVNEQRLRLYLVRHGITSWNREMRMQGHSDIALDAEGLEQADRVGARLSRLPLPPERIWSSDLSRARVTAEAIAAPLGLQVQTTPLLREIMLGDWEGLTRQDIIARGDSELLADYLRDAYRYRPPGGETIDSVFDRMAQVAQMIREECPTGQAAVVGHGGSLRALVCLGLDAAATSLRHLWLDNASLSILEETRTEDRSHSRILLLNETSHLTA